MQLSCLPVSFFPEIIDGRMTLAEWARMAAGVGLDGLDLSTLFLHDRSDKALAVLRREIEATGLGVIMLTSYPDFTHPDAAQRRRELAQAQDVVRVATALGAKFVRVTAGQAHPRTSLQDGIDWAVEGLTCLYESSRDSAVTLAYENHGKPSAWEYTDFSQPPEIFLEIARRTADLGLPINFDTANATSFADNPLALLEEVVDRVVSVHAADTARRGALVPVLLGTGVAPFGVLFRRLKEAGFDGWLCMEEASGQGREGVEAAARFIRQAWEAA